VAAVDADVPGGWGLGAGWVLVGWLVGWVRHFGCGCGCICGCGCDCGCDCAPVISTPVPFPSLPPTTSNHIQPPPPDPQAARRESERLLSELDARAKERDAAARERDAAQQQLEKLGLLHDQLEQMRVIGRSQQASMEHQMSKLVRRCWGAGGGGAGPRGCVLRVGWQREAYSSVLTPLQQLHANRHPSPPTHTTSTSTPQTRTDQTTAE